jgi:hypothetical protein
MAFKWDANAKSSRSGKILNAQKCPKKSYHTLIAVLNRLWWPSESTLLTKTQLALKRQEIKVYFSIKK